MKVKSDKINFRSTCPVSSALDLFGDKWSLLIVRDIVYFGKRTFKDFADAEEGISTARLADRLKKLESIGVINKSDHPTNKKVYYYDLTQKGLDLFPIVADYILWSDKYLPSHISDQAKQFAQMLRSNREGTLNQFMNA